MADFSLEQLLAEKARRQAASAPAVAAPAAAGFSLEELMAEKQRRQLSAQPGERTWGDTAANLGQSFAKGATGLAGLVSMLNPFDSSPFGIKQTGGMLYDAITGSKTAQPPSYAQMLDEGRRGAFGDPDYSRASKAERYAGAAMEALPYAATGGGALSAMASGVGAEAAKDAGVSPMLGAIAGGVAPAAIKGIGSRAVRAVGGDDFLRTADSLEQQAIGAKYSDYLKSAKSDYIDPRTAVDEVESGLRRNISEVIESGTFKNVPKDPQSMLQANNRALKTASDDLGKLLGDADRARQGMKIIPREGAFKFAQEYIRKAPVNEQEKLTKYLDDFIGQLQTKSDGSISFLQGQKKALQAKVYGGSDLGKEVVDKYIQADLRELIERTTDGLLGKQGAIRGINRKLETHIDLDSILRRELAKDEGGSFANTAIQAQRTSGGTLTGPTLRGAALGASAGAVLGGAGAGIGGALGGLGGYGWGRTLGYLASPEGKFASAAALRKLNAPRQVTGAIADALQSGSVRGSIPQSALVGASQSQQEDRGTRRSSTPASAEAVAAPIGQKEAIRREARPTVEERKSSPSLQSEPAPATKQDVAALIAKQPPLIQAVIRVESSENPRAISPKGAKGLMQLMPANVKAFKVADPFDPVENIRGGAALLQEELQRFRDPILALAAYNAGSPRVQKAIQKAGGSRQWVDVAKHLPKETRDYVMKVKREHAKIVMV